MVELPIAYRWLSALGAVFASLLATSEAQAHIKLTEPAARYDSDIKGCPCGKATGGGGSNSTCNVAMDGSDPNRNDSRVFTAAAGSTLVIKFQETIGHTGLYRVAFDEDGADFADFNANVLAEADDPNDGNGARELTVTLPNTPCTNCTLQLIQVMNAELLGGTVDGAQLDREPTYYTCADIVLTGDGTPTSDETSGEVSTLDVGSSDTHDASSSAGETFISSAEATSTPDVMPTSALPPPPATGTPPMPPAPDSPAPPAPQMTPTQPSVTQAPSNTTTSPSTTTETAAPNAAAAGCAIGFAGGSRFGKLLLGLGLAAAIAGRRRAFR